MINESFLDYLLKVTGGKSISSTELIQPLWSNYGSITRYTLTGNPIATVVVKHIDLKEPKVHPRGWSTNLSHKRKLKSYKVETKWYQHWNSLTNSNCRTPRYLGSYALKDEQWIILEDLDHHFPLRKNSVTLNEIRNVLKWLAHFHATYLLKKPEGLWHIGTYWNLDTRPDEYRKIEHQGLKAHAHKIDDLLNTCVYSTFVHGDAKLANFCFAQNGNVAAVDFQYVGAGCGMKDVTYFLGSCLTAEQCEELEPQLLDYYFLELRSAVWLPNNDKDLLEEEWRQLFPIASADFMRFMLGWLPTHYKVNNYELKKVEEVLSKLQE